jgi:DNA-binding HxlR family transcriptional regulator
VVCFPDHLCVLSRLVHKNAEIYGLVRCLYLPFPISPAPFPHAGEVNQLLGRMGDKWTIMTITMLVQQPRRFNELKRMIGGISQQMLTRTLRSLEGDGLVSRKVHPSIPPQVEYSLTPLGQSLARPLIALSTWVLDNVGAIQSHREQVGTPPVSNR